MTPKFDIYYHYTSITGALGIISSRRFWFTDYRFLNDRLELHQALNSFLSQIPKTLQQSFRRAFQWHDLQNHHCVFSLSKSPTILSQWRAYASDATGVALGLNSDILKYAGFSFVECRYEDHDKYAAELVEKHSEFIHSVNEASAQHVAENAFMEWIATQRERFYRLVEDLIALKNPAFGEEKELRAVKSLERNTIKMRVARDLIIPYTEANIFPDDDLNYDLALAIPEIWLGPKCNELNRWSLLALNLGLCMIKRHDCGYV